MAPDPRLERIADADLAGQDFAFPSGQPAADVILDRLRPKERRTSTYKPFTTPLILATFRRYADALVNARVATPRPGPDGGEPVRGSVRRTGRKPAGGGGPWLVSSAGRYRRHRATLTSASGRAIVQSR
jgi:hypothetical protein